VIRGLYTAASGLLGQLTRLDVVSNNIANAVTNGYYRDRVVDESFPDLLLNRVGGGSLQGLSPRLNPAAAPAPVGTLGTGMLTAGIERDLTPQPVHETGNPLDLAAAEGVYFVVQTPDGPRYTRQGQFTLNPEGSLVTGEGHPVLGQDGPIKVPPDAGDVTVDSEGRVSCGDQTLGRLLAVGFATPGELVRQGSSLLMETAASGPPQAAAEPGVRQGALSGSNVQPVLEMVGLITVLRNYETGQRLITAQDETLRQAVNEVGRLA